MIDVRNQILERLPEVCRAITGMAAVGINCLDVPGIRRPAVIINDGIEEVSLERPTSVRRFSQVQIMDLTPDIRLLLRTEGGSDEARELVSLFRARVISAILGDSELQSILGANGAIRYGGCTSPDPSPEAKETRLDFTFVFTYPLKLSDLTA